MPCITLTPPVHDKEKRNVCRRWKYASDLYECMNVCAYIVYRRKCENACKSRKKNEKAEKRERREEKTRNVEATNETLTVSFYL